MSYAQEQEAVYNFLQTRFPTQFRKLLKMHMSTEIRTVRAIYRYVKANRKNGSDDFEEYCFEEIIDSCKTNALENPNDDRQYL